MRVDDSPSDPKGQLWQRIQGHIERDQERSEELEHERKLAAIRTESHALVWTGTADELTATITKWYESSRIIAPSLLEALQSVSIHFIKPDGTPVLRPLSPAATPDDTAIFSPSPTYQQIIFRGKEFDLTQYRHAPRILKVLHESINHGDTGMTTKQIREKAKLPHNGKMYDWFRGTGLWKHLVISIGKDLYRLDIPGKP